MKLLIPALSNQERVYLEHMHWDSVGRDTAGDDTAIRKGLEALAAAQATSSATRAALLPLDDPPGQVTSPGGGAGADLYADARKVMLECYGEATCNGVGCVAATLQAHLDVYGPIGSPPKPPGYADLGAWQCSIDFTEGEVSESCSFQGWCWQETIEFPGGTSTCHDAGWTPGPNPTCGESAVSDAGPDAPQLGASCMPTKNTSSGNVACGSGLTCHPLGQYSPGETAATYGGECGPPRLQGESCFEYGCATGLRCINENVDPSLSQCNSISKLVGECIALGGAGAPCFANACYCQEGTFCTSDPTMTNWQCE